MSIARRLAGARLKVILLESGGLEFDSTTQVLYAGPQLGRKYYKLDEARLRFFGGSTNHWQGWCGPMDREDFEAQKWIEGSGWPITYDDLHPYYLDAQGFNELGPWGYDASVWARLKTTQPPYDPSKLATYFWQFADETVRYGKKFLEQQVPENVQIVLNANVTEINLSEGGQVANSVTIRSTTGRRAQIKARSFVLACGGIENPRILLASRAVQKTGIGNDHDLVGRFFMEHPHVPVGRIVGPGIQDLMEHYNTFYLNKIKYQPAVQLAFPLRQKMKTANAAIEFFAEEDPDSGLVALRRLRSAFASSQKDWGQIGGEVWKVLSDMDEVAKQAWRRIVENRGATARFSAIQLLVRSEQTPNPSSRVVLAEEKDALGVPRAGLNWVLNSLDQHTVKSAVDVLASEAGRLGQGRVKLLESLKDGDWFSEMYGGWHHMGTTRMSNDPKSGVVDRNSKVHGVSNLYMAGSSVFTTGGFTNPTLTIVALAYRLADHLKTSLIR